MPPTPTRGQSGNCSVPRGRSVFSRYSANDKPQKIVGNMTELIKNIIRAWKYKRAVKKADALRHITHRKYMVLVIGGKFEVLSKQEVRKFVAHGVFRKGITTGDIERKALYITM